tara:strand:+ start:203 stop:451 length:249 start_codon:yes stop_codon:yes gene_type:complete
VGETIPEGNVLMDREHKTSILVFRWMQLGGISQSIDDIYKSAKLLITSIYDKLPDNKINELYEETKAGEDDEVSNNNNPSSN